MGSFAYRGCRLEQYDNVVLLTARSLHVLKGVKNNIDIPDFIRREMLGTAKRRWRPVLPGHLKNFLIFGRNNPVGDATGLTRGHD
jgi:hypothetical protein